MLDYDLVIIGCGPAGLAATARARGTRLRVAAIDGGKPIDERDRTVDAEMTRGHGGAGLFSDGKFSFFPSATALWSLPRQEELQAAYHWTCELLDEAGLTTPPFPDDPSAYTIGTGEWVLKDYPSDYLSLTARLDLIASLVAAAEADMITETQVVAARYDAHGDHFVLELRDSKSQESLLTTHRLVVAGGRFGPLALRELTEHQAFHRLEVGFRIEQAADRAFFRDMRQLDPKLRFREAAGDVEWRTFCACRQGEAVLTETQGGEFRRS